MYLYIIILLCAACLLWRHMILLQLSSVRSRDIKLLSRIRRVHRLLCSSETPEFNPSKDRSAYIPGMSRRGRRR